MKKRLSVIALVATGILCESNAIAKEALTKDDCIKVSHAIGSRKGKHVAATQDPSGQHTWGLSNNDYNHCVESAQAK